jgi:hypothetical protein
VSGCAVRDNQLCTGSPQFQDEQVNQPNVLPGNLEQMPERSVKVETCKGRGCDCRQRRTSRSHRANRIESCPFQGSQVPGAFWIASIFPKSTFTSIGGAFPRRPADLKERQRRLVMAAVRYFRLQLSTDNWRPSRVFNFLVHYVGAARRKLLTSLFLSTPLQVMFNIKTIMSVFQDSSCPEPAQRRTRSDRTGHWSVLVLGSSDVQDNVGSPFLMRKGA